MELKIDKKALHKLQKIWEERLEKSGFIDIERITKNGERHLKESAADAFRDANWVEIESKLDFFLKCSSFCAQTKFKRPLDQKIMEMFCDGIPKKEIKEKLQELGIRRNVDAIQDVVRKYLILFGMYGVYGKYLCDQRDKRGRSDS